jgi:ferredoxin
MIGNLIIDQHLCVKCGKCAEVCPDGAVLRKKNDFCSRCIRYCMTLEVPCNPLSFFIDNEKCTNCGLCVDACPERAIMLIPKRESAPEHVCKQFIPNSK